MLMNQYRLNSQRRLIHLQSIIKEFRVKGRSDGPSKARLLITYRP